MERKFVDGGGDADAAGVTPLRRDGGNDIDPMHERATEQVARAGSYHSGEPAAWWSPAMRPGRGSITAFLPCLPRRMQVDGKDSNSSSMSFFNDSMRPRRTELG